MFKSFTRVILNIVLVLFFNLFITSKLSLNFFHAPFILLLCHFSYISLFGVFKEIYNWVGRAFFLFSSKSFSGCNPFVTRKLVFFCLLSSFISSASLG